MTCDDIPELRFLIVEDQDFQREALALLLGNIGARHIFQVENGRVALDFLKDTAEPIDVILCDIDMPEMDGMAYLRNLAETGCDASVILVSALDRALLDSVETMAKDYGVEILGAMPNPPSRSLVKSLIATRRAGARRRRPTAMRATIPQQEIIEALKKREFTPYFQPKVEIGSGKVVGLEALARWSSPTRGLLAPGAFLDDVEAAGLMDGLTFVMLAKSAAICRHWQDQGLTLAVSVNLSLSNLGHAGLAERIHEVVTKHGVAPASIILEVTESAAMSALGPCLENLARLRLLGFGLSLDDYGTGYSSLQQLSRVPFTEIKIDRSFVQNALHQEATRVIVESTLDMARKLGLEVTAEGIETVEQWEMLARMGCDLAQGYLIAKPMPHTAVANWVGGWQASAIHLALAGQQSVNILLVEDESFQRETYGELLAFLELGQVHTARGVAEALETLAICPFDLVITDVELDDGSGLDLVRLIRTQQTAASPATRVIVLSAHHEEDIVLESIVLDINGFLTKPAAAGTLRQAIANAMAEDYAPQPPSYYQELGGETATVSASIPRSEEPPVTELVPLGALRAGMILAEPLYNRGDLLVLAQGTRLTPSIVNRLSDLRDIFTTPRVKVIRPEVVDDQPVVPDVARDAVAG